MPVKAITSPSATVEPFAGAVMLTVGGVFTALTVRVTCSEALSPPLSVTEAVIVCSPADSVSVTKDPPLPMTPSTLELQDRLPVRSPSSRSTAVPVKAITSPSANVDPSAGAVMVTAGAWLPGPTPLSDHPRSGAVPP